MCVRCEGCGKGGVDTPRSRSVFSPADLPVICFMLSAAVLTVWVAMDEITGDNC